MGAKIMNIAIDRDVVKNLKRMFKNEENKNSAVCDLCSLEDDRMTTFHKTIISFDI